MSEDYKEIIQSGLTRGADLFLLLAEGTPSPDIGAWDEAWDHVVYKGGRGIYLGPFDSLSFEAGNSIVCGWEDIIIRPYAGCLYFGGCFYRRAYVKKHTEVLEEMRHNEEGLEAHTNDETAEITNPAPFYTVIAANEDMRPDEASLPPVVWLVCPECGRRARYACFGSYRTCPCSGRTLVQIRMPDDTAPEPRLYEDIDKC